MKSPGLSLFCVCLLISLTACTAPGAEGGGSQVEQAPAQTPLLVVTKSAVTQPPTAAAVRLSADDEVSHPAGASQPALPTSASPAESLEAPGCSPEEGRFEGGSLSSKLLPEPLEFSVYLPPCYHQDREQRYPVLYLLHGQGYNHDQWDRLGADESADRLILAGEIAPFLIVLPRDRSWAQPDEDLFGQALVEELIPHIDSTYRTRPERLYRAIGGLSRGAAWAVHLGLSRWQEFGRIGAHSLPVFFSDAPKIRKWLESIPAESTPWIYLDIGERDRPETLESARWFENLLTEEGVPHEWHLFSGYHEESYWQAHVEQYLRWYAGEW
ncbi:MAG TPA: alpha/beta hydrolase-fold protein [Anaerolineales bacterium]|nr:alpha/beta hydrolase-fold protein [Anaerolineales bacterium]